MIILIQIKKKKNTKELLPGDMKTAIQGHERVVELLLGQKDVSLNCPDENDRTLPVWAAVRGEKGVVKALLDMEEIDHNCSNKNNETPLRCAAVVGHEGVVKDC